ncbi:MAG: hypothetical protein ACI976_001271 [Aureispira sp.]|jgi:hypothetical protein
MQDLDKLKFPIGEFNPPTTIGKSTTKQWITSIDTFPSRVEALTKNLDIEQRNWKDRPEGWSIKQVVHHCADSHMNSLIRFKLALTEDSPNIRPYWENRWAELPDSLDDNLDSSLLLLKGLHQKWVFLLKQSSPQDLDREFVHPEQGKRFSLKENIGVYAWHCNHHLAHIEQAIEAAGSYL